MMISSCRGLKPKQNINQLEAIFKMKPKVEPESLKIKPVAEPSVVKESLISKPVAESVAKETGVSVAKKLEFCS